MNVDMEDVGLFLIRAFGILSCFVILGTMIYMVVYTPSISDRRGEFLDKLDCEDRITKGGIYYCMENGMFVPYILEYDGYRFTKIDYNSDEVDE